MRNDVCANCGQTIYLVKIGPDAFRWATDPEKPEATSVCAAGVTTQDGHFHLRHAPVSGRETHR